MLQVSVVPALLFNYLQIVLEIQAELERNVVQWKSQKYERVLSDCRDLGELPGNVTFPITAVIGAIFGSWRM